MITIEVFGPGCQKCKATEAVVHQALQMLGLQVKLINVRDPKEMAGHGVMFTPAVRINGELKCTGRVPQVAEVTSWLAAEAARDERKEQC